MMTKTEDGRGLSVVEVIARRVSCRAYRTTPVSEDYLRRILEAARLAPSACNAQPWRFAVVRNPELRRRIVEEGFLPGIKMTWAIDAPVHVVIGMERSLVTHRLAAVLQLIVHSERVRLEPFQLVTNQISDVLHGASLARSLERMPPVGGPS